MKITFRSGDMTFDRPKVMGILNVTPDSFSDGGTYSGRTAVEHALKLSDQGADIVDIGCESTRPGFHPVSAEEELERLVPVLKDLIPSISVPVSVDTMKPEVAEKALDLGADMINDVNGLRAPGMMELIASAGVPCVIMHMTGTPETVHTTVTEVSSLPEIARYLEERKEAALDAGIRDIVLDPGIGFGKTDDTNIMITELAQAFSFGCPVLIAPSRKRFLKVFYPDMDIDDATVKVSLRAIEKGANIVRVHNVKRMVEAINGRT